MGSLDEDVGTLPTTSHFSSFLENSTSCFVFTPSIYSLSYRNIRNFSIGIFGILANMGAIIVIMKAKKINKSLKIYLTSLTVNDIIFMVALTLPVWRGVSRDLTCTLQTLGSISSFAVSNIMTALISFHNYQAVMNPLTFQSTQSVKRAVLIVVIVWLTGWSLSMMSIGSINPQKDICRPSLKIPKFVFILSSTINAISLSCVLALNMLVVYFLKTSTHMIQGSRGLSRLTKSINVMVGTIVPTSTNILPLPIDFSMNASRGQEFCQNLETDSGSSKCLVDEEFGNYSTEHLPAIRHSNNIKREQIKIFAFSYESKFRQTAKTPAILHVDSPDNNSHCPVNVSQNYLKEIEENIAPPTLALNSLPVHAAYNSTTMCPQLQINENRSISVSLENETSKCTLNKNRGILQPRIPDITIEYDSTETSSDMSRKYNSNRCVKMRKIGTSLCIITLWCCCLDIPNFIYTMLSVSMDSGREQLDTSLLNMIGSTMVMVNALSNPFIYAWRFLEWSRVCFKLNHFRH